MNREEWLNNAVEELRPYFAEKGYDVPEVHVSCGWPSTGALAKKRKRLGECWNPETAEDGISQIYISPLLKDGVEVLGVLIHEMIHAVMPKAKHGKAFKLASKELGLEGPAASTFPGETLREYLEGLAERFEDYPQPKLTPSEKKKKDSTRMKKIVCESNDDEEPYILRGSKKMIDWGLPQCPVCGWDMEVEEKEEEV